MRVFFKTLFFVLLAIDAAVFSIIGYLGSIINSDYKVKKGDKFSFDTVVPITAVYNGVQEKASYISQEIGDKFDVKLKAFGVIPFSTVSVEVVDELHVAVLGTPFGMRLYTDGVLVIDISSVETEKGNIKPAEQAGIKKGDYIVSVDGKMVYTNEDLMAAVKNSMGDKMKFLIKRNGKTKNITVTGAISKDTNEYMIGLWVRDSSAGIGTLTFYSPYNNVVCGLGHGVCDEDTGEILQLNSGELVTAEILAVTKGASGEPGELKGKFNYDTIGRIDSNQNNGVYSVLKGKINISNLTEIALKQDVKEGKAQILCTINGSTPELYSCEIKKRNAAFFSPTQNLIIKVTDKKLLNKTGGIVQGMSGAPILQNGKLIGAVTHVLIDDPTSGYGIFAENMLETAKKTSLNKLKEAS